MLPVSTSVAGSRPPITKAIDVWALGVTLYCFVYGRCPFIADTEFELFNIIPRRQPIFPDSVPGRDFVDPELKDLLARLLEKDVYKRITLKEVKEHPWVTVDLPDPVRWRIETDPGNYQRVHVTDEEVKSAVTIMDKIKNRIRKLSVSLSNFSLNRRRSKSISSTYTPDSPTTEHGPIPIIRSPNSSAQNWCASSLTSVSPMSLPERIHNPHLYSSSATNLIAGRLERPDSICSNASSIDEVDEGDEHSGHSGSGSSAQNNTSYVGRRRLFSSAGLQQQQQQQYQHHHQQQYQHPHQHQPQHPHHPHHPHQQQQQQQQQQYQYQYQHQQSAPYQQQGGHQQRRPSFVGFPTALSNNALATRRTQSDDQLDQAMSHRMGTSTLYNASGTSRGAQMGHSALSKSWVYSPTEVSPLSPVLHDSPGEFQENVDDRTPTQHTERNIPEDHGSPHYVNDL
ncbi:hypothetical protein BGX34_001975 [Mortierella sp. NVP85]|nr:hypothetical protein BGX34_001975 [Mortierella sp. NVP85]